MEKKRCKWAINSKELSDYHDNEYGFRITDNRLYFERLILEIFQAGLSWSTILKKRESFRKAFDDFDFYKIANYDESKINNLLNNKNIIKNRRKIEATVYNAGRFIDLVNKFGSFDNFINKQPLNNKEEILKVFKQNFKFVGPFIIEEFLMSVGLWEVKHEKECFMYKIKNYTG